MKLIKTLLLTAVAASSVPFVNAAPVTLYEDHFSTGYPLVVGEAPETVGSGVGLDGNTYQPQGNSSFTGYLAQTEDGHLVLGPDIGVSLSLTDSTGFTLPSQITLNVSFNLGDLKTDTGTTYWRGIGMGFFYDTKTEGNAYTGFTGILINKGGSVHLTQSAAGGSPALLTWAPAIAGWNATNDHTLTYTIDLTTGGITSLLLDGIDLTTQGNMGAFNSKTGVFTADQLSQVGFYANSASANTYGYIDQFSVTTIPEPSTVASFGLATGVLLLTFRKQAFGLRK